MTTFNRLPEKPNVPPPLHKLSNELARIGVIYKSPHQLTLPAKSLRVHTPSQIKKIGHSLSVFGFLIPILIDEADSVLVDEALVPLVLAGSAGAADSGREMAEIAGRLLPRPTPS